MQLPHALRHVAAAVRHAECLADEADDLKDAVLAHRLRSLAAGVTRLLEGAVSELSEVEALRVAREEAHGCVAALFHDVTMRIEQLLPIEAASSLLPGGHLDVVERARFRLRRLVARDSSELHGVRLELATALTGYDDAVDAYLSGAGSAQAKKDRAIVESQALRLQLERAKKHLLTKAPAGGEAWKRIRRRAVRTKRARWLDDARARGLLASVIGNDEALIVSA